MSQHHSFHSSPKHSTFPRLSSSTTHIPRSTTTLTVPSSNSISNQKHFTMGNCLASLCPRVEISKDPATRKVSVKLQQHGDEKSPATAKVLPTPERIGDRTLGDPEERPGSARKTDAANAEDAAVAENGNVTRSGEVERPPVNWREAAARAAEVCMILWHGEREREWMLIQCTGKGRGARTAGRFDGRGAGWTRAHDAAADAAADEA